MVGGKVRALQLFKLQALRRGMRGLQETVKGQEERLKAVLFWRETTTRRGLRGLFTHVQSSKRQLWAATSLQILHQLSFSMRKLRDYRAGQREQRERSGRAVRFHLTRGTEYAKRRVLERLLQLKVERLDGEMRMLKAADIHRKATFLRVMRGWIALGEDLYRLRLAGKVLTALKTFNQRKQLQNSYCAALQRQTLRKSFHSWRKVWAEVSNLHEEKLANLSKRVTFWAFFAWKKEIHRQKRKIYAEFEYQIGLKRRFMCSLRANVAMNLHYSAITKQLARIRCINALSRGFSTWLRGIQCLKVEKWRKRKSQQHYNRNLQEKAVNSLKKVLKRDIWRVHTLIPKRKRLLKRFFIHLWTYQASKSTQLLAKSKQFRLILKKSRLKRHFGLWIDKYHSKAAANRLENRKIRQARGLIGSSSLRFCFNAWVESRDLALIQHLKREKGRNHYRRKVLKERIEEWRVRARVNRLERGKKTVSYWKNWQRLVKTILFVLKENYERRKIRKNVIKVATNFAEKQTLQFHFRYLRLFLRQKQAKKSRKRFALAMRKNDLVADSLRRVVAVGFQWRSQRLALTHQSREHKDRRVWAVVARCAEVWKEKALKRRKTVEVREKRPVERTTVRERALPEAVMEERKGSRPPPRRLNSAQPTEALTTRPKPARAASPVPQSPLPAPIRPSVLQKSPEARLMEIEAELLEYKIEKEHLQLLAQAAATPSPVLLTLRLQYQQRLPRINTLFTELAQLRSLLT